MNLVDFVFINFIIVISILGTLINLGESYLPIIILQTFRYGKHSYKGAPSKLVQLCEIPKSYFRHFYAAALIWSLLAMWLVTDAYLNLNKVSDSVVWWLDLICGSNREPLSKNTKILFKYFFYLFCSSFICSKFNDNIRGHTTFKHSMHQAIL